MSATQLEDPVVVHVRQQRRGRDLVAEIDPHVFERDGVAGGDEARGMRPERLAQLGQRRAQARPRAVVEHVGPEARGEVAAAVRAGVRGEVREQATCAARPRRRHLVAVGLDPQAPGEPHTQHRPTLVSARFTIHERCTNGARGHWPP
jgi:hypothetical protein